ncbi:MULTISPECIES: cupin domain-containing protein [unclassified Isoptericola]|uniref:cupin domain-containing protein n=1 Tax=Isoptericola sp. NPDC057191 TaxID=3346041 RepID=UPI00362B9AFB
MSIELIEQSALPGKNFEGYLHGSGASVIFSRTDRDGAGPRLHRHPYPETFVIRSGRALFHVGDDEVVAVGGQILVAPAQVPHKFTVIGPELYEGVHIHASDRIVTEWLE